MRNSKGFTLIELLVVIAIIGLLSTLAVIALNSARAKSRDSKRISDVKQIQTALELFYSDMNGYPTVAAAQYLGNYSGATNTVLSSAGFSGGISGTTYMGQVPKAPTPADGTCVSDNAAGASGNNYGYASSATTGTSSSYTINFCLGAATGDLLAGNHTATPNGIQ
jgi:prepilin-type N-terminal cleavage/methylation domain-containing protein